MTGNQLREEIRKLGLTQDEAAEKLGVTRRTLQNWFRLEKLDANISQNVKSNLNIDFSYWEENKNVLRETPKYHGGAIAERRKIPFWDDVASVGGHNTMVANCDTSYIPTEFIDTGDWFPEATAAIRHYGDSMIEYPSGCILALKRVEDARLLVWGRNYVVETPEFRITKQLQDGGDDYILAYSSNMETYPDGRQIHSPIKIPKETIRHIDQVIGCVVKEYSSGAIRIIK